MRIDASDYDKFAAKLRGADKAVARAIRKRLREAGAELGQHVRNEGSEKMPGRGGLRGRLLGSPVTTALKAKSVEILVGNRKKSQFALLDQGRLRHPVYGRKAWVSQDVPASAFSEAFQNAPSETKAKFEQVLADAMKELGL